MEDLHKVYGTTYQDSIEIGTPSKGGVIKVYGDFSDIDGFKKRIDDAILLRKYLQDQTGILG
jgi:hypothetical protein